jgi:putative transcriptional regulator
MSEILVSDVPADLPRRVSRSCRTRLAKRKTRSRDLAARIGIAEQNLSLLKSGKVKGVRFDTLERICAELEYRPEPAGD